MDAAINGYIKLVQESIVSLSSDASDHPVEQCNIIENKLCIYIYPSKFQCKKTLIIWVSTVHT